MGKKRSKSSGRWLDEHDKDEFVKKARLEGWRSRAVYKLSEVQDREPLIKPGFTVVDLGAAPGSWSQYVSHILNYIGRVIALDILDMDAIAGHPGPQHLVKSPKKTTPRGKPHR